jgi:hypothetical protein
MPNVELVTAADVQLMQGLAQRVTATRLDLVNSEATFGDVQPPPGRHRQLPAATASPRPGRVSRGYPGPAPDRVAA